MCRVADADVDDGKSKERENPVLEVSNKAQERRLYWYGRVMRREESHTVMKTLNLQMKGRRFSIKPKRRWRGCIGENLRQK